ncbi:MAG: DUF2612 domain-containing protein [Kiritimatiellae bacterium]|nr:DUF2612 domain-containing protein [Kiritimatiellia bacterium]
MDIASTDTSINLARCVLWQYDHAPSLLTLLSGLSKIANVATDDFWQGFLSDVMDVDSATGEGSLFDGLEILGRLIGVQRPAYYNGGAYYSASDDFYRRLIKAHNFLTKEDASSSSIGKYLVILFGAVREIDISSIAPYPGDSVDIGGITYTFISAESKYGEVNEVKIGADNAETAENLAAVVNGTDGYAIGDNLVQKANPNVSPNGATASDGIVTLKNEYWNADGASSTANVVVVDNDDMTIDYRVVSTENLSEEEIYFISPYDQTTGIMNGGQILGYSRNGEERIGYFDEATGAEIANDAFGVLFPFPAGVRTHIDTPHETFSPLGLNETEETGQNRANFVYDQSQTNGAPYSGTGGEQT